MRELSVTVVAYMTKWCPDCTRARRVFQRFGVSFEEIDIESAPGMEDVMRAINGGSGKVPTILLQSDTARHILVEPGDQELTDLLRAYFCQD